MTQYSDADHLIARATRYAKSGADAYRYDILKRFCSPFKTILSIGSAGYEPVIIGATHAIDVTALAGVYLAREGWKGRYFVGSVTALPFGDHEFECGVCSEVIEHLPSLDDVNTALDEINRVCKNWIVTTPCRPVPEPDHKHFFSPQQVTEWVSKYQFMSPCRYYVKVYTREIWHFLTKLSIRYLHNCPFCPIKGD